MENKSDSLSTNKLIDFVKSITKSNNEKGTDFRLRRPNNEKSIHVHSSGIVELTGPSYHTTDVYLTGYD